MGCDIHFHVEMKTAEGWVRAEPLVKNQWHGQWDNEPEFTHEEFYGGRNYSLFAMLADVRNDYGIAPIVQPRGLPGDASESVRASSDDWGVDGHSHSWLSLAELFNVPWHENNLTHSGWVTPGEFERFDKFDAGPKGWCKGVSGARVKHVENDEMRALIANGVVDPRKDDQPDAPFSYYTHISWPQSWAKSAREFMSTIVRMAHVATKEGLSVDDVRAVFWFDN